MCCRYVQSKHILRSRCPRTHPAKAGSYKCKGTAASNVKGSDYIFHPPSMGFRFVNEMSKNHIRMWTFAAFSLSCACSSGSFVSRKERVEVIEETCDYLQDCLYRVIYRGLHSQLGGAAVVEIDRNLGYTKKQRPTERLHFTCGNIQLLTSKHSRQH